jgi:hypothetical protein
MKPGTKLALRRFAIRWARKLLDFLYESLDGRLHAEEVSLREHLEQLGSCSRSSAQAPAQRADRARVLRAPAPIVHAETFMQWEARKSGVAVVSKKEARRQRTSAAGFDLRFSSQH